MEQNTRFKAKPVLTVLGDALVRGGLEGSGACRSIPIFGGRLHFQPVQAARVHV